VLRRPRLAAGSCERRFERKPRFQAREYGDKGKKGLSWMERQVRTEIRPLAPRRPGSDQGSGAGAPSGSAERTQQRVVGAGAPRAALSEFSVESVESPLCVESSSATKAVSECAFLSQSFLSQCTAAAPPSECAQTTSGRTRSGRAGDDSSKAAEDKAVASLCESFTTSPSAGATVSTDHPSDMPRTAYVSSNPASGWDLASASVDQTPPSTDPPPGTSTRRGACASVPL